MSKNKVPHIEKGQDNGSETFPSQQQGSFVTVWLMLWAQIFLLGCFDLITHTVKQRRKWTTLVFRNAGPQAAATSSELNTATLRAEDRKSWKGYIDISEQKGLQGIEGKEADNL